MSPLKTGRSGDVTISIKPQVFRTLAVSLMGLSNLSDGAPDSDEVTKRCQARQDTGVAVSCNVPPWRPLLGCITQEMHDAFTTFA